MVGNVTGNSPVTMPTNYSLPNYILQVLASTKNVLGLTKLLGKLILGYK